MKESSLNTSKKYNDKSSYVSGSALFFGFSLDNTFSDTLITGERIHPYDIESKLPKLSKSGPIFIECRNYFDYPRHQKGMLVAFQVPNDSRWHLGVIHKMFSNHMYMQIYVLGDQFSDIAGLDPDQGKKIYPLFYNHSWKELTDKYIPGTEFIDTNEHVIINKTEEPSKAGLSNNCCNTPVTSQAKRKRQKIRSGDQAVTNKIITKKNDDDSRQSSSESSENHQLKKTATQYLFNMKSIHHDIKNQIYNTQTLLNQQKQRLDELEMSMVKLEHYINSNYSPNNVSEIVAGWTPAPSNAGEIANVCSTLQFDAGEFAMGHRLSSPLNAVINDRTTPTPFDNYMITNGRSIPPFNDGDDLNGLSSQSFNRSKHRGGQGEEFKTVEVVLAVHGRSDATPGQTVAVQGHSDDIYLNSRQPAVAKQEAYRLARTEQRRISSLPHSDEKKSTVISTVLGVHVHASAQNDADDGGCGSWNRTRRTISPTKLLDEKKTHPLDEPIQKRRKFISSLSRRRQIPLTLAPSITTPQLIYDYQQECAAKERISQNRAAVVSRECNV